LGRHRINGQPIDFWILCRARLHGSIRGVKTIVICLRVRPHDRRRTGIKELANAGAVEQLGILAGTEILLPKQVCSGPAWNDHRANYGWNIVVNSKPERRIGVDEIVQPGTPDVDVHNGPGVRADKIIRKHPGTAVPRIITAIQSWRLDKFQRVGFDTLDALRRRGPDCQDQQEQKRDQDRKCTAGEPCQDVAAARETARRRAKPCPAVWPAFEPAPSQLLS